jgi:hypothetical protein
MRHLGGRMQSVSLKFDRLSSRRDKRDVVEWGSGCVGLQEQTGNAMSSETAEVIRSVELYLDAAKPAPTRSGALIRELSMLFALGGDGDGALVERFDRLFLDLAESVDADARGFVAVKLSVAVNAPSRTVVRLAHDDIAVARPLLVHSPALSDADLIELAIAHGIDHMMAIASISIFR